MDCFEVQLNALGTRFEPLQQARNIKNLVKDRLHKRGLLSAFVSLDGTVLYVAGAPLDIVENIFSELAKVSAAVHQQPFGYNVIKSDVPPEQAMMRYIQSLEAEQARLERQRLGSETQLEKTRETFDERLKRLQTENTNLEGRLRMLQQAQPIVAQVVNGGEKVFVPFFQVPHDALAEITGAQSSYIRIQDFNFEHALQGIVPAEALELMKLNRVEFLSARLETKITKREDLSHWLDRQDHAQCNPDCVHAERLDNLEIQYASLRNLYSFLQVAPPMRPPLVYLLADETGTKGECTVYLPIGKSDGWLTKQMRDHVTETLMELYGKGRVHSNKDLKVGAVRRISTRGASSDVIKEALLASQAGRGFSRFGYSTKIITFKEISALQAVR
ncbi:MAG: hypothetical protein HYT16_00645 [DPANN group archaeon]|nr:hypothetical protein [DPANN group archaeon]